MTEATDASGLRGRTMVDREGDKIGKIDDVYDDRQSGRPEWALVNTEEHAGEETISEDVRKERIETDGDDARS